MNLIQEIRQARKEVAYTKLNLEFATGEYVDEAIHLHNAAIAKYKRLLLEAKTDNIKAECMEIVGYAERR
ncbi:MAG: DUF2508 family protein [Gottschalkiaceae bacterium]|nr:MAG: DUF2508 family protein [Gottschalkiaceae bacterium]